MLAFRKGRWALLKLWVLLISSFEVLSDVRSKVRHPFTGRPAEWTTASAGDFSLQEATAVTRLLELLDGIHTGLVEVDVRYDL